MMFKTKEENTAASKGFLIGITTGAIISLIGFLGSPIPPAAILFGTAFIWAVMEVFAS